MSDAKGHEINTSTNQSRDAVHPIVSDKCEGAVRPVGFITLNSMSVEPNICFGWKADISADGVSGGFAGLVNCAA